MATFKQYTKKNGDKAWMFTAYLGREYTTGKQVNVCKRGFPTKKAAQSKLVKLQNEFKNDSYKPNNSLTPINEVYDSWFETYKTTVKESTWMKTELRMKKYILPTFGDMHIEKIDTKIAQKEINKWAKKFGMYTVLLNYLKKIGDFAVTLELIDSNPFNKVVKPKQIKPKNKKEKELKFYTKEQLKVFLDHTDIRAAEIPGSSPIQKYYAEFDKAVFRLLAFSGARIGELLALKWSDVNFDTNTLTISKTLSQTKKGYVVSTTKTDKSNRVIPMDPITMEKLKYWRLRQKEFFFLNGIKQVSEVFTDIKGNMIFRTDLYQRSKRIAEKASLHNIGCHGFRHTHASILFESNANFKEVQERLGHSSIDITMDVYTHLTAETNKITIDNLASYVGF